MRVLHLDPNSPHPKIVVHPDTAVSMQELPRRLVLHFGAWQRELPVEREEQMPLGAIGLCGDVGAGMLIPADVSYEVRQKGRHLYVGPVIGICTWVRGDRMTEEMLRKYERYLLDYQRLQGVVLLLSRDRIDPKSRTVEGFYFCPDGTGGGRFKPGRFPYPSALFSRAVLPKEILTSLQEQAGDVVFNSYFFDKWEMWEWLSPDPQLRRSLPETALLQSSEEALAMVERYGTVYLKIRDGSMSDGIYRVQRAGSDYAIHNKEGAAQQVSSEELTAFLRRLQQGPAQYLVQQPITVLPYEGRHYDFRVILQKDGSGRWQCPCVIARFGRQEGITISNFTGAGRVMHGHDALQIVFGLTPKAAFQKIQEMKRIGIAACRLLDGTAGHYGDVGLDMMVDHRQQVWLLEINKLHDHRMPLYGLRDPHLYRQVLTTPLHYAKSLAGFGDLQTEFEMF